MSVLSNLIIGSLLFVGPVVCPFWSNSRDSKNLFAEPVATNFPEPKTAAECNEKCQTHGGIAFRGGGLPPVPMKTGHFKESDDGGHVCNCVFSGGLYHAIRTAGGNETDFRDHQHSRKMATRWLQRNGFRVQMVSFHESVPSKSIEEDSELTKGNCTAICIGTMGVINFGREHEPDGKFVVRSIAMGGYRHPKSGRCICFCDSIVSAKVQMVLDKREFNRLFAKGGSASCKWLREQQADFPYLVIHCPDDEPSKHTKDESSKMGLKALKRSPFIRREEEQPSSPRRESRRYISPSLGRERRGSRSPSPGREQRGSRSPSPGKKEKGSRSPSPSKARRGTDQ
nr:PREDICTED: uncharacterized protein LOC109044687 [Bemisia tabaci]